MLRYDLEIPRGGRCRAIAWPLLDEHGDPIAEATANELASDDDRVVAKARRNAGDDEVLHTFTTSIVNIVVPGQWDGAAVPAVQLDEIPRSVTAGFTWDRGVWGLMVDDDELVGGGVTAPWVVPR